MFNAFRKKYDRATPEVQDRIPPGQYLTEKFPVLHYGSVPNYRDLERTWDLRVWGEIAEPAHFSFAEFRALPTVQITTDIHCVTRWSKLDTIWEGVRFKDFLSHIPALKPDCKFVLFHCEQGFTANQITISDKGESENLVPTGDGVREPQNRCVEIVMDP